MDMRYTLDFENGVGQRRLVSVFSVEDADHSDVFREAMGSIHSFCAERGYRIPYVRNWNQDHATVFDVGSHTEFFYLHPAIPIPFDTNTTRTRRLTRNWPDVWRGSAG